MDTASSGPQVIKVSDAEPRESTSGGTTELITTLVAQMEGQLPQDVPDRPDLIVQTQRMFEAYLLTDLDAFDDLIRGAGLDVHPSWRTNAGQETFKVETRVTKHAALQPDTLDARWVGRQGQRLVPDHPPHGDPNVKGFTTRRGVEPRGSNDILDVESPDVDVIEVRVDGRLNEAEFDDTFKGALSVLFARRGGSSAGSHWIPIQTRIFYSPEMRSRAVFVPSLSKPPSAGKQK